MHSAKFRSTPPIHLVYNPLYMSTTKTALLVLHRRLIQTMNLFSALAGVDRLAMVVDHCNIVISTGTVLPRQMSTVPSYLRQTQHTLDLLVHGSLPPDQLPTPL